MMNKNSLWITLCALGLGFTAASAADVTTAPASVHQDKIVVAAAKQSLYSSAQNANEQMTSAKTMPSFVQIGGNYTYVTIKPEGLPSFHGNLGGAQASYEYKPMNSFYGALTTNWKQGSTHGKDGKRKLLYIDVQERFGYTVTTQSENMMFTFFTGLGYRHLGHKFIPTTGSLLYFRYNEIYIPVGIFSNFVATSWFNIGVDFTWMPQAYPTVSIVPLKGARWILTETLKNFYAALPLDFSFTDSKMYHLVIRPFYERWQDGHSTAETSTGISLGLPGNTYNFWGVDVNFGFCF